ncbi:MAG: hypothetical protein JF588_10400 [Caulobacterales bacterium]|nr:hypothetical protein [Caulobacterales bacterium]
MGRYEPLHAFLAGQQGDRIPITFGEIEQLLGVRLPASKRYPAWWSNNPSNNPMTKVWLAAGFVTEQVDTAAGRLVFRRAAPATDGVAEATRPFHPRPGVLARLQASLGGTVCFAPGFDPTAPTGEAWDAER